MKKTLLIITILVVVLFACNNSTRQQKAEPETPKALQDGNSVEILTKRSYDDLVENLYREKVEKVSELKELETAIKNNSSAKSDVRSPFSVYDEKNSSYYQAANSHITRISDSLLRNKIKSVVASSVEKYNYTTSSFQNLLKEMDTKSVTISDWHTALKLIETLPLIEKYQQDSKPAVQPMQNHVKEQDKIIDKLQKTVKE
jgi:hypothetical protein